MDDFKLIAWDLDGTLLDDEGQVKVSQVRTTCEFLGLPNWQQYVQPYYGVGYHNMLTELCAQIGIADAAQVWDIDRYLRPGIDAEIHEYVAGPEAQVGRGTIESLSWVQDQGITQGIATGASPEKAALSLEVPLQDAGPLKRFFEDERLVVSRGDKRIPNDLRKAKPDPGLLIHLMHQAGVAPQTP